MRTRIQLSSPRRRRSSIPETSMIEPRSPGVLDHPPSRVTTVVCGDAPSTSLRAKRPSLTRLGILDIKLAHRARYHKIIVIQHQRAGDAVLEQFERHRIHRRLLAVLGLGVAIVIAHRDRPA